jgi:L-serine dehydratase
MAETGSAGGMAIAALALQNLIRLICDPKGKRVEATCLGRNVMAASNAVSSAKYGPSKLCPFNSIRIGHIIRCTNLGGLSVTKTTRNKELNLENAPVKFYKSC